MCEKMIIVSLSYLHLEKEENHLFTQSMTDRMVLIIKGALRLGPLPAPMDLLDLKVQEEYQALTALLIRLFLI